MDELHDQGYTIVCPFSEDELAGFDAQLGFDAQHLTDLKNRIEAADVPLFQYLHCDGNRYTEDFGDRKRLVMHNIMDVLPASTQLQFVNQKVSEYVKMNINDEFILAGQCGLVSLPIAGAQDKHTDIALVDGWFDYVSSCDRNEVPLSVSLAYGNASTLRVWPGSHKLLEFVTLEEINDEISEKLDAATPINMVTITIPAWHMVIFRQDLVHAGDANRSGRSNLRWFSFAHLRSFNLYGKAETYTNHVAGYESFHNKTLFVVPEIKEQVSVTR